MLIVGLGNPGPKHVGDRHNVGFWLADLLAAHIGATFSTAQKLQGEECRGVLAGKPVRIVKPATYMNRSGQCVRRVLDYYNIPMEQLLVLHDELDLPAGSARLKRGGGHGGAPCDGHRRTRGVQEQRRNSMGSWGPSRARCRRGRGDLASAPGTEAHHAACRPIGICMPATASNRSAAPRRRRPRAARRPAACRRGRPCLRCSRP